ncbi:hypothetical protein O6P43_013306 [Quillaja saponaria]|uniref:Uncharacterized protein n=1 Tax=Quillaja saponaria TaxID=32244 RepID=A0AAD7PVF9_QUISA|nr:hypothetical protein O6P43_013306 [Quillaja saponaria]
MYRYTYTDIDLYSYLPIFNISLPQLIQPSSPPTTFTDPLAAPRPRTLRTLESLKSASLLPVLAATLRPSSHPATTVPPFDHLI